MSESHVIRMPGILLDELKTKDYDNDERFNPKKRRAGKTGRREKRKQQRLEKKQKRGGVKANQQIHSVKTVKPLKEKVQNDANFSKKKNKKVEEVELPFSSDDDLSSGDFDSFDAEDLNEEEWQQLNELEAEDDDQEEQEEEQEEEQYSDADIEEKPMSVEETMEKLKALKEKKQKKQSLSKNGVMSSEEVKTGLEAERSKKSKRQHRVEEEKNEEEIYEEDDVLSEHPSGDEILDEDDALNESDFDNEDDLVTEMSVEETMAALKVMKEKKKSKAEKTKNENKNEKRDKKKSKQKEKETESFYPLAPSERAQLEKDEMDMQYYAKKLGLKGKKKKLHATDEYDAVGGLLEGLDFFENVGGSDEEYGDFARNDAQNHVSEEEEDMDEISETEDSGGSDSSEEEEEDAENPFSSDDELSSGDFEEFNEEDLDEEEWEQLRELEGGEGSSKHKKQKENPYVAPAIESSAYVPPSLRKKQLGDDDSVTMVELRKKIKSALNKLSESNISIIVSSLNDLYETYPRQYVTDAFSNQIIEVVGQKNKLLDGFIMTYAGVTFSLWRLRGVEMGASFVQDLVQKFIHFYDSQLKLLDNQAQEECKPTVLSKECSNLITLLSYCYNFGMVACKLIYDLIKLFIENPNEFTTELLLRVVSVSGQLIRGDDPMALKEILSQLLNNVKSIKQTPRMKFLLETMSDLKNNRLKPSIIAVGHQSLKKNLTASLRVTAPSASEPLQVSLDDIKNVDTKGKWWLVGASWKGNMSNAFGDETGRDVVTTDKKNSGKAEIAIEDDLLEEMPDWAEIAKHQRMNTDVRRAIFISIMSAQDFVDAFTKLEKLNLKNKQSLEISKVLIHCLSMEGSSNGYNPYYSLLGAKICEHNHHVLKSFQFLFWDIVKKFENDSLSDSESDFTHGDDELSEDARLRKILNQGRFFGYLLSEGILRLDVLKHVPIMGGLNDDGMLFLEVLLFQLLLSTAKKSECRKKEGSKKTFTYKDDVLQGIIVNGIKLENKSVILKALKWFVTKKFKFINYVTEQKGTKGYERDVRRLKWATQRFIKLIDSYLADSDY